MTDSPIHKNLQIDILKSIKRNNNRYLDILPYSFNAVPFQNNLKLIKDNQNDWYINASYINGPFINDENFY
jgi:protein tyrosine phosphatase